jgi:putative ABC transport system permease protein
MEWRRWLYALRARLRAVVRRRRAEHDLHDELSFHVAMQVQANVQGGMSGPEAERRARLALGGVEQAKEHIRDVRPLRWADACAQDLRYALRSLRRAPGFTVVALLTLALGIGANTAIFSIVNGVILRPLGYPRPEQLMFLSTQFAGGSPQFGVSPPEYLEFREINRSFSAVGAYRTGEVDLTGGDRPRRVRSANVDEHLLKALGVQAAHGRLFAEGETDVSGGPPPAIVILSHELWQSAFGGQPIVGQTIEVSGRRGEVLGIMPPGVDVMDTRPEIWLPLGLNPANRQIRGNHSLFLIGRLKDGVTAQSAQTELDGLIESWGERVGIPRGATGAAGHVFAPLGPDGGHILQMEPVQEEIVGAASRSIWVLQGAVGLVLLIACANLANLLLARAETRQRELAVRTALGASRGRLLRQFITEGVLLSIVGGALGLWLARVGVQALVRAYPTTLPRTSEVAIDPMVLLFTIGVSTASGVLFGLAPIMHTRVKGLPNALKEGGGRSGAGAVRHHIRHVLVTGEVALAVMLVAGAGLLARTVYNLTTVDAGFDRSRLVTFSMTLSPVKYPLPSARAQMFQRLLDRLRTLPGVQAATAMTGLPPTRPLNAQDTDIDNYTPPPDGPGESVDYYQNVMSDYFETMGIPIVQGRSFQPADAASSGMVAVVNEMLADTFWKGLNPIGQRLRPCCFPGAASASDQVPWFTVIGVAKDVKQGGVDQEAGTEFYQFVDQRAAAMPPAFRNAPATINVVLRTTLPAAALSQTVERVVREVDRTVPVVRFRGMESVFTETIQRPRLLAQLVGAFAALALLLAVVGTYGVLSYMVTARRREIGIRLALGADRSRVQLHVMKQGLLLTAIGLAVGLAGAAGANRLIRSLLFGVQPTDVPTLATVVATIALVATMACWLPAWRASRLDPNVVLRDE